VSLVLRVSTYYNQHPPTIHGVAMKRKNKMGDGRRDPKDTRQTVQDKDNAPSNNQQKVTKNGRPEEANFVKKQISLHSSPTWKHISVSDTETRFRVHPTVLTLAVIACHFCLHWRKLVF
jgi:hypothetical protein